MKNILEEGFSRPVTLPSGLVVDVALPPDPGADPPADAEPGDAPTPEERRPRPSFPRLGGV